MIEWMEANWPAPAGVRALTTLRRGGASEGPFAQFNPADHVGDDPEAVDENRRLLEESLKLPGRPVWLDQVHGSRVVRADEAAPGERADGAFTDRAGTVCVVLTADCLPLLLCSRDGETIAAVHGGWRGLLAGVVEAAIAAMGTRHAIAWLGPAIGPAHFQVGDEVRTAFLGKSRCFEPAFRRQGDRWLADLYVIARIILHREGVDDVFGGDHCTFSEPARFYSYRRDNITGRMATLIWRDY